MKTRITALALIAVTALSFAPKPAQASDKTLAVLGGFIGGVIVASELNHNQGYATAPAVVVNDRFADGYWREFSFRVWVQAHYVVDGCDRYGREVRHYVPGRFEIRTNREWVSYNRHDRDDRHDREVGSGYGHRR